MDEYLPDGSTKLPMDFALQHPMDYLEVAELTVPAVLKEAGVSAEAVVGLSTDFTSCTFFMRKRRRHHRPRRYFIES